MTGSSARRLRQAGTNLLAGRALVYHLYPFTSIELKEEFHLDKALHRGLFLTIAAKMNCKIINCAAIARYVGVDDMTIALLAK